MTNFRITPARNKILEIFSKKVKPISVKQLQEELTKQKLKVNKTTIYRELAFMLKNNLIKEVRLAKKLTHYESADLAHHHHLVCNHCGKIDDVTNCLPKALEKKIELEKGFEVCEHKLEFYGLCANCQ